MRRLAMNERRITRRQALWASSAILASSALTGPASAVVRKHVPLVGYPFLLGVASGDPSPRSVVLWTRLAPDPAAAGGMPPVNLEVEWAVARDEQMAQVVRRGVTVARPELAHSVHVEARGLEPERWYYYQFRAAGELSPIGRTRTAPAPATLPSRVRFAFASCQHYETGFYTAYEHMLGEDLDLVVHLGDYIYEGPGRDNQVRQHVGGELHTLEEYRSRYTQYRMDLALQAMHAAAPWIVTWDDHEFDNNYAGGMSEESDVDPETFLQRRAAAYQAYYEHMPLRRPSMPRGPYMRLFRQVPFGQLINFFVLDTRQYRSDQPCGDGTKPPCDGMLDPQATLLGPEQETWLLQGLAQSATRWNVLAQQVMMARVDRRPGPEEAYSMDQWPGYEIPRRKLLTFLREQQVRNPIVLTGDIHSNWVNDLSADFDSPDGPAVATEFVGTSISSGGDGSPRTDYAEAVMAENPCVKLHNAQRGYVRCEVTPERWQADYRVVEYVSRPGAPRIDLASFVVEDGRAGAQKM